MKGGTYILKCALFIIAQTVIWNCCNFTQYLTVTFLPAIILGMPVRQRPVLSMAIAFAAGLAADFLCGAPLGLSSAALVPAALVRRGTIRLVFGNEILVARREELSANRQGWMKMAMATAMLTMLFLAVYIAIDSAGTRPLWMDAVKFAASAAVSIPLSLPIADTLCTDADSRWK